jgi:hypothetical protein
MAKKWLYDLFDNDGQMYVGGWRWGLPLPGLRKCGGVGRRAEGPGERTGGFPIREAARAEEHEGRTQDTADDVLGGRKPDGGDDALSLL